MLVYVCACVFVCVRASRKCLYMCVEFGKRAMYVCSPIFQWQKHVNTAMHLFPYYDESVVLTQSGTWCGVYVYIPCC